MRRALGVALGASDVLAELRRSAEARADQFSMAEHARRCLTLCQTVADRRSRTSAPHAGERGDSHDLVSEYRGK